MRKLSSLAFLLSLFAFAQISLAVSFTVSVTPSILSPGQSNLLLNFTVNDTGSVNITQINITMHPGYTFTGTSGATPTTSYTGPSTSPSWTNASSLGLVGNGSAQYFWIYVNAPSVTGNTAFNITISDANSAFNSSNVTIGLSDVLAPAYSVNTTSPASNSTYASGQSYLFNVTWKDGMDVSKVLFEHNFTGTLTNTTMSNYSSLYYYNASDLSAGTYVWRTYANDTNNTFNSTNQVVYIIRQATNTLDVYLNDTLNSNITATVNGNINVTVNGTCRQSNCNVSLSKDGSVISNIVPTPYSTLINMSSVGTHNITATLSGNTNFTNVSTTYHVAAIPSYTTVSSMPLTFTNTTLSRFNISFSSDPSISSVLLQLNLGGTSTNYTMSNDSTTNYYYNISLPAGSHAWRIYGTYSTHTFAINTNTTFTISKAAPTLNLNITPQWDLDTSIQTNVSCTSSILSLTPGLYRNGTAVSNPDVQTFTLGNVYKYFCNNTINENYTTDQALNYLSLKKTTSNANLSFIDFPSSLQLIQNSSADSQFSIKNTGTLAQTVKVELQGIDNGWYSFNQTSIQISAGATAVYKFKLSVPSDAAIKEYSVKIVATGNSNTTSKVFSLKVLPSDSSKTKISDTLDLYMLELKKLEAAFGDAKKTINDTSAVSGKILELNATLKNSKAFIDSGDYFNAQQTLEIAKALISTIQDQLKAGNPPSAISIPSGKTWLIVIAVLIVSITGIAVFLFKPPKKGFNESTKQYTHREEEDVPSEYKDIVDRFKDKDKKKGDKDGE